MDWSQFAAEHGWKLPLTLALMAASAFFSGAETALFQLSPGQLYRMAHSGHPLQRLVASLMSRPQRVLNSILLSNLVVNTAIETLAAVVILDLERQAVARWLVGLLSIMPVLVLVLLCEVTPKVLAFTGGTTFAQVVALPISLCERVLRPVVWGLQHVIVGPLLVILAPRPAEREIRIEELEAALDLSVRRGVIGHEANELLQEVMELTDLRVGDVMVPRVDVIAHDLNEPPEKLLELFRRTRLRRVPVYEGDLDHVLGVVHSKRLLLAPRTPIKSLIQPVPFVPQAGNLEKALLQFRATRTQMAIVVDEFGGAAGLLTLEDILEEIVGDIPDEHSAQKPSAVERISDREYLVDGDLPIHEWAEEFRMRIPTRRISTVGGFVVYRLGRIPRVGDSVDFRNLRMTVQAMRGRRVSKVQLELLRGRRP